MASRRNGCRYFDIINKSLNIFDIQLKYQYAFTELAERARRIFITKIKEIILQRFHNAHCYQLIEERLRLHLIVIATPRKRNAAISCDIFENEGIRL